jgi:oxygen-dependent protoporphyrinogen oxidase
VSHVVVVGGGIAGLAAADALLTAGATVTVIEATAVLGGKLAVSDVAGVAVDEGAESFLRRRPEALDLVAGLGLGGDLVSPVATTASVWARGSLRPIPARTVMGVPSDPSTLRGVLSALEVARVAADRLLPGTPPGDDVAVGRWLARRLGPAVVDRLVDPLLAGTSGQRLPQPPARCPSRLIRAPLRSPSSRR